MRVRDLATQHPLSARRPFGGYFGRKFRFSEELMVSYFNLMIASDLCFATTPVDAWHEHDLMALGSRCTGLPLALRHTDDRYRIVDPSQPTGRIISA